MQSLGPCVVDPPQGLMELRRRPHGPWATDRAARECGFIGRVAPTLQWPNTGARGGGRVLPVLLLVQNTLLRRRHLPNVAVPDAVP
jgi:hypothetical protein